MRRPRRPAPPMAPQRQRGRWRLLLGLFLVLTGGTLLLGAWTYQALVGTLAPPGTLVRRVPPSSTKIYDRTGKFLFEIFDPTGGKRTLVPLAQIPRALREATIATEDGDFYANPGVSLRGALRALLTNLRAGEIVEGGSGITQQLVKNVIIPPEERFTHSFTRKLREAVLAFEITRRYSKDQILEWYLNEVYYGNLSYGVEAAAQTYFGKHAADLTLAESAFLAGLVQAPARYSPSSDLAAAKARQSEVLELMVRRGFITTAEAEAARQAELHFRSPGFPMTAPHFVTYVRERLEATYGRRLIEQGGLRVVTTLDLELQQLAERTVQEGVRQLAGIGATNGALVAIEPASGEVLALVGSADFWNETIDGQVNVALRPRQPGSAFKPITYLAAFLNGYSPATMLLDVPTRYPDGANGDYVPQNADGTYRGPVRVRQALAQSLNPPAVRALQFAGVANVVELAHRLGITDLRTPGRYGLSLTLGGGEVKLLDLTYAYSVLANGGVMAGSSVPPFRQTPGLRTLEPTVILEVTDPWGNVLEEHRTPRHERIVPAAESFLVTDILTDANARAPMFGLEGPLTLAGRPAAVKTGTTTDYRDFWTIGYTPQLAVGVWVGNTNGRPMKPALSTTTAAPIWNRFLSAALARQEVKRFLPPPDIEYATVCAISGQKPTPFCPLAREVFVKGQTPTMVCPVHRPVTRNGQTTVVTVLPPEAAGWLGAADARSGLSWSGIWAHLAPITQPVRSRVAIVGSVGGDDLIRWELHAGQGAAPKEWVLLARGNGPVHNAPLAVWQPGDWRGPVTLRLTARDRQGGEQRAQATVEVRPPL
ncbi:MAG: penicillin-binding protein 1A [Dehalococcoidia bacterium]|nr:MAG: penicillin-binding protein 1A [Dehalococcoidia bacterium]